MKQMRMWVSVAAAMLVVGCASVANLPINIPTSDTHAGLTTPPQQTEAGQDDLLIGLSFSGGGTRAAAFSFGALQELAATPVPHRGGSLLEKIDFISGVSGGSVTAAYFGLKKRAALDDFRERFLIKDAEADLRTNVSLANLSRAIGGGVNEDTRFRSWLDANLFEGATFADLRKTRRPRIWINATDIYNRTPFVFGDTAFSIICSDLSAYPVAGAVAASAAVPVAFAPVVIETFPDRCHAPLPGWIAKALKKPDAPPILRAFAEGVRRYQDGSIKYIKLLDGGLVDNFGLSGFTVARESAETPYGPLTPAQAVKLRRMLFIVVDAGLSPQGASWVRNLQGPSGAELVNAITNAAMDPSKRASYTAFDRTMQDWRTALVKWRCSPEGRRVHATVGGPACGDLRFYIGRVSFEQLDTARATELNAIPTSLKLPVESVDALIAAGREALRTSSVYRGFLGSL